MVVLHRFKLKTGKDEGTLHTSNKVLLKLREICLYLIFCFSALQLRLSTANSDWSLCPTYPKLIVVPNAVTDSMLFKVITTFHRSRVCHLFFVVDRVVQI